jgi:hypothetical protein
LNIKKSDLSKISVFQMNPHRDIILASIAIALTMVSLLSTPTVDNVFKENAQMYPFFYAFSLPIAYYVSMVYLTLLALIGRGRNIRLFSLILLGILIELTPSVMLTNPWVPDQYPFLSEPVWLIQNHHIGTFHTLAETPGLGLEFSQVMLLTNIGPFILSKAYPLFVILALLLITLSARLLGKNEILAGILFLGFNFFYQMNIFHRQTFSYLLFLLSIYLLLKIIHKPDVRYSIAYFISFLILVISHPGASSFLAIALIVATAGIYILKKNRQLITITLASVVLFFAYYLYVNTLDLSRMLYFVKDSIANFFVDPTVPAGTAYLTGYTQTFQDILTARVILTMGFLVLASIVALWALLRKPNNLAIVFMALLHLGLIIELSIFLYQFGLSERPLMFLIFTCALLISSITVPPRFNRRWLKPLKIMGLCVIMFAVLSVPVLRYSGVAYLQPSSAELEMQNFFTISYNNSEPIYITERNLAYNDLFLESGNLSTVNIHLVRSPDDAVDLDKNYMLLSRFETRDGYWNYTVTYRGFLENLENSLQASHNIVYASSGDNRIYLMP